MKKLLKIVCALSFLLLIPLVGTACGEPTLEDLELSIADSYATYVGGNKGYIVEKEDGTNSIIIPIQATLTPSSFSADDLSWSSTYTDVATVNDKGVATCKWSGTEDRTTTITATYSKGNVKKSASIFLTVTSKPMPKFESDEISVTYTGLDLKNNFKVSNEDKYQENFRYKYIDIDKGLDNIQEIVDCGNYRILFVKETDKIVEEYARINVKVVQKEITLNAISGTSVYGDAIQSDFYNSYTDDTIENNGINITGGIGKDTGASLGKMIYTTTATNESNAGTYEANITYKLTNSNYKLVVKTSQYTIQKRSVVLKVNDQNITYGGSVVERNFFLYDYSSYVANNNSFSGLSPIAHEKIDYKKEIETHSYILKQNGNIKSTNSAGYFDAGTYKIGYESVSVSSNFNAINVIEFGTLIINKKNATITPDSNLFKEYGEDDIKITYTTNDIYKTESNNIVDFLSVDYASSKYVTQDFDLGINNRKAPAGEYNYKIDNTKNSNYNLTLDTNTNNLFTVKKCEVVINFENQEFFYKAPTSSIHSVSYYNLETADYVTEIASVVVAGTSVDSYKSTIFDEQGTIVVPLGDEFSFKILLSEDQEDNDYYLSYNATLDSTKVVFSTGNIDNYNITITPFKVNLKKIVLTVTPNAESTESSKTFDAKSGEDDSIKTFLSKYTLSSNDISDMGKLSDITNILQEDKVLSLRDSDGKYNITVENVDNETGEKRNVTSKTSEIRNAGKYEVFLATNLQYKDGMEYVSFVLDNSTKYYFTIKPKDITIIPKDEQKKIYCEADPILLYEEDITTSLTEVDASLVKTGSLSRIQGENYGAYLINIGTLSYGSNYNLTLSSKPIYFTIEKRKVTVKPFSYTVTYGNDKEEIGYNYIVDGSYDENLYEMPTFSGKFSLTYNGDKVSTVGDFYPVKKETNTVVAYNIAQGDFKLTNNNYSLTFDDSSTYLVEPKDIYIDISPTEFDTLSNVPAAGGQIDVEVSSYTPLISGHKIFISATEYKTDENNSTYYVENVNKLNVLIKFGDINMTDCYNVILEQNIVYRVRTQTIEFKVVLKNNTSQQQTTQIYNGTSMEALFELVVATEGYVFTNDLNNQPSKYSLIFSNSKGSTQTPTDVGSYSVDVQLNEGDQLVVKKEDSSSSNPIVFTSFNTISNSCLPVTSQQKGFLNIEKAKISYDESLLAFENGIYYKDTKESLSNILTTNNGKNVFSGVNNSSITLKTFNDKNYEFVSSPSSIEMLTVGTHNITLSVTAEKNGSVDLNYETLTIDVPLVVLSKEIEIDKNSISITSSQGENLVYNGSSKSFSLSLTANLTDYTVAYNYVKLEAIYEDDVSGKLQKFKYENNIVSPVMTGSEPTYSAIADLPNVLQEKVKTINYNSSEYIVIGENCYLKSSDSSSTQNAGIYLCLVTVSAKDNYILKYTTEEDTFSQSQYLKFFEIKKSNEVEIINWKKDFAYETAFNVNLQDTLPFEYSLSPDFKSDVEFLTDSKEAWAEKNYILDVGQYQIKMRINTENCFYQQTMDFNIVPRKAQVLFDTNINTYEYSVDADGKAEPKTSFINSVEAIYTKGSEEHTETYIENEEHFNFTYYNGLDEELKEAPGEIGEYYVICEYSANNYAGSARYDYRITQMRYQGVINATDKVIEYNPTYTAKELQTKIMSMLIYSDDADIASVEIKDISLDKILDFSGNDNSWIKEFVTCESPRKLKFIIHFNNKTLADRDDITAKLTFNKISISSDILSETDEQESYVYIGKPIYKELEFKGITLTPKDSQKIYTDKSSLEGYSIVYGQVNGTEIDSSYITINDNLNNLVFTLKYNYYKANESGTYESIENYPISPSKYKVEYKVVQIGSNYSSSFATFEREFVINKTRTLSISLTGIDNKTYSGTDFADSIYNELISSNLTVKNSTDTNVNFNLYKNESGVSSLYNEDKGICLIYSLLDSKGVQVQEVVDVGTYQLKVSLMFFSNFNPENYFTSVVFNGTEKTAEELKNSYSENEFLISATQTFEITKAVFPYSLENEDKIKEFAETFSLTKYEIVDGIIKIASDGTFTAPEGYSIIFKLGSKDYSSFEELPVDKNILVTISSNNYSSGSFTIIKYSST